MDFKDVISVMERARAEYSKSLEAALRTSNPEDIKSNTQSLISVIRDIESLNIAAYKAVTENRVAEAKNLAAYYSDKYARFLLTTQHQIHKPNKKFSKIHNHRPRSKKKRL